MTQEYKIWKPEHDGHAPPNWRDGMPWDCEPFNKDGLMELTGNPSWYESHEYKIPAEALNSPNDDAANYEKLPDLTFGDVPLEALVTILRHHPAEELAKHGITLAPEKDVFVELFADVLDAWGVSAWNVSRIRSTTDHSWRDEAAIELLRQRFEQMIAERSKRDA